MTSFTQIMSNRRNAQKSTGPKSEVGKARSSTNALRHGLRASKFVAPIEDRAAFLELRARIFEEWKPQTLTEEIEVDRLARIYWQRDRAEAALAEMINSEVSSVIGSEVEKRITTARRQLEDLGGRNREDRTVADRKKCRKAQRRYLRLASIQYEVNKIQQRNSIGIGAALCRLGAADDKLSTLVRYLSHWELQAQRTIETLRRLKNGNDDW